MDATSEAIGTVVGSGIVAGLSDDSSLALDEAFTPIAKDSISFTATSSCTDGGASAISSPNFSATITGGGGGTCTIGGSGSGDPLSFTAFVDCSNYTTEDDDGTTVVLDGGLGATGTFISATNLSFSLGSDDLTSTIDGTLCSVDINATTTFSGSTATASGCLSVCGSAFTVSGSENL